MENRVHARVRFDMELVSRSVCLVLSGVSSMLVGHWCLDHYSWLLTTDLDGAPATKHLI